MNNRIEVILEVTDEQIEEILRIVTIEKTFPKRYVRDVLSGENQDAAIVAAYESIKMRNKV